MIYSTVIQNMDKQKKPLLTYEQVVDIIDDRILCDEDSLCDERIVRVEKAARDFERKNMRKKWGRRLHLCLQQFCKVFYRNRFQR
ncbi:hypothetical protein JN06_00990 [Bacteroides zoogleoformans]|uniref:Uncharacterized protein n=1 Tax=Bacteroides zoogleoformans TaxID=28119 RepID=A0ABN5IH15_9BACE|nr:hypothetical protein C4H11_02100 [Bacteroides zoogleoformans]TWJ17010.1 hypothetical protein JN06_00990 [Bacteroides zoogleoformans]